MSTSNKPIQTHDPPKETPVGLDNFATVRTPELLDDLLHLTQLLNQGDTDQYWQRCAEILLACPGVDAVSIWLFPNHETIPEVSVRLGDFRDSRLLRIERWENALRNAPVPILHTEEPEEAEEFQPVEVDKIELGIGLRAGDLPILHIHLDIEGLLHGGVSLALSTGWTEGQHKYQDLTQMVRIVTDNGLRQRQLSVTRHRLDQMSLIAQVTQSLNGTLDLETVLQEITEMTSYVLQAQASTLFLADERRNQLLFYLPTGAAGEVLREMRIPISQGIAGWVASERQYLIVNDAANDSRFSAQVDEETGFKTESILCVPLLSQGRLVGVLEVLNKEAKTGFTQEDLAWLETMGSQAAVALENARLYQDLRNEKERMIQAEEGIRRQLNRDLHDGPAQLLNLIIMNVDIARRLFKSNRHETVLSELDLLENLGRHANREIRTLLFELRPLILESQGLVPALRSYARQLIESINSQAKMAGQTPKPGNLELVADDLLFELTPQAAKNIFSVVQEATNNIRKYANADNVWIRISIDDQHLLFSVEDDGIGFDLAAVQRDNETRGSFGLLNMYERTEMIGGVMNIESPSPNTGKGVLIQGRVSLAAIQRAN